MSQMIFRVELPDGYHQEQNYVIHCLLREFLGFEYETSRTAAQAVRIHDGAGRDLVIAADLFCRQSNTWLTSNSLPREPLAWWDVSDLPVRLLEKRVPVLYGNPSIEWGEKSIRLDLDIVGGCFFFLGRLEEAIVNRRDAHDRFSAAGSLASRCGFLHRPVVDEYVELLWMCLQSLWPNLQRRERIFRQNLTHDVDQFRFLPRGIGRALKHRRVDLAAEALKRWICVKSGKAIDPYDTFDLIMDISEASGVASEFYFITQKMNSAYEPRYAFESPAVRSLLKRISERGHTIGLHAGYNAYLSGDQIGKQFGTLKRLCQELGIRQEKWGGRQHYLRWRTPDTFQHWDDARMHYDSTLGFADAAGFRCGTCHEFPTFNLATRKMLRLRERPLIAMECSVLDPSYQNLGATSAALDYLCGLKNTCRHYGGEFTVLWHNHRLVDPAEQSLYRALVAA